MAESRGLEAALKSSSSTEDRGIGDGGALITAGGFVSAPSSPPPGSSSSNGVRSSGAASVGAESGAEDGGDGAISAESRKELSVPFGKKSDMSEDSTGHGDPPPEPVDRPRVCIASSASRTSAALATSASSLREILSKSERSIEDSNTDLKTTTAASEAPATDERRGRGSEKGEGEDDDVFSDALDTLSRAESCFMNCSTSGLSGGIDSRESSLPFSRDPQLREFMMDRFLPAAQALVSGSAPGSSRKTWTPVRKPSSCVLPGGSHRRQVACPPSQLRTFARGLHKGYSIGDGDVECEHAGQGLTKGCGLFPRFCIGSSFRLFNAVPRAKPRGRSTDIGFSSNAESEEDDDGDVFKICGEDGGRYWEVTPHRRTRRAPGSSSNSAPVLETLASILSRPESESEADFAESEGAAAERSRRIGEPLTLEARERPKVTNAGEPRPAEKGKLDDDDDEATLQVLLPPALPKSPTESWLWRTLPSLPSRGPAPHPFLGAQIHRRKQAI